MIEFFMPMDPPTVTAQERQVTVRNGKPVFYDPPKVKDAKDKLLGQIDDAMKTITDMSEKIAGNTDESDEIANFGIKMDKSGKMNFFADINGSSFKADSMDDLIKTFVSSKTA